MAAYRTNLPLIEAMKPDVLLVHQWEGAPLTTDHGGFCMEDYHVTIRLEKREMDW